MTPTKPLERPTTPEEATRNEPVHRTPRRPQTPSDDRVSLHPLDGETAVQALLATPPSED